MQHVPRFSRRKHWALILDLQNFRGKRCVEKLCIVHLQSVDKMLCWKGGNLNSLYNGTPVLLLFLFFYITSLKPLRIFLFNFTKYICKEIFIVMNVLP